MLILRNANTGKVPKDSINGFIVASKSIVTKIGKRTNFKRQMKFTWTAYKLIAKL